MKFMFPSAYNLVVGALASLVLILMFLSLMTGDTPLSLTKAFNDILHARDGLEGLILLELRLPRALLGALVGFSLGITGAAMQGLLRNPLAEPGVMGISGAAALGAVIVFYGGLASAFAFALPLGAASGAAVASLALFILAGKGTGTMTLVLAGVAINSLAGALTALTLNLSSNPYAAMEIVFWLMGSLADHSLNDIAIILAPMLAGWTFLLLCAPALNALTLGEEVAASLGFDLRKVHIRMVIGSALAIGSSVAITGMIGFVGLVAPHLVRPLAQQRPGHVLLLSGFSGAILTLLADICLRLLPTRTELNLGVVTALIGAPFLFILIRQLQGRQ